MEVMGWFRILRRRWRLTLLLVLLALVATAALAVRPGPYTAQSQVVMLSSQHASEASGGNPYLSFGDSDTLTADIVGRELMAPGTVARLGVEGFSSSYTVADDPTVAGPILDVSVTGNSKTSVVHTLHGVTAAIGTTLASMQANLAPADQITSVVIFSDPTAKLSLGKKARTLIVALGIGLILAIALPQVVDATVGRRRRQAVSASASVSTRPVSASASVSTRPEGRLATEPADSLKYLNDPDETLVWTHLGASNHAGQEDRERASAETTRQPPDFDSGFR